MRALTQLSWRKTLPLLATFALSLGALPANAHWADLAVAEFVVEDTVTRVTLTFPTALLAAAVGKRDGHLEAEDIRTHQAALQRILGRQVHLTNAGGQPGAVRVEPVDGVASGLAAPAETHSTVVLVYTWPAPVQEVKIRYDLFLAGVSTASCLATIVHAGQVRTFVFTPDQREFTLAVATGSVWHQAGRFLVLGITHILTGPAYLVFLLALLMPGDKLKPLLKIITAYTGAYSVTLALGVLGIVTLPPRLVGSGIALSIVYVASERLWTKETDYRGQWLVAFGVGLIHGLGYAAILQDLHIPDATLAVPLLSFNAGLEVGLLAAVCAAFLVFRMLQQGPWVRPVRTLVSVSALATGLIWFAQHAFLPA